MYVCACVYVWIVGACVCMHERVCTALSLFRIQVSQISNLRNCVHVHTYIRMDSQDGVVLGVVVPSMGPTYVCVGAFTFLSIRSSHVYVVGESSRACTLVVCGCVNSYRCVPCYASCYPSRVISVALNQLTRCVATYDGNDPNQQII